MLKCSPPAPWSVTSMTACARLFVDHTRGQGKRAVVGPGGTVVGNGKVTGTCRRCPSPHATTSHRSRRQGWPECRRE